MTSNDGHRHSALATESIATIAGMTPGKVALATRYDGPFVIAEVLGKGSYRLEKPTGSPVKVLANSRDLKPVPSNGYASPVNSPGKSPAKSQAKKQTQTTRDVVASDPVWISALNLRQTAHQQRAVGK